LELRGGRRDVRKSLILPTSMGGKHQSEEADADGDGESGINSRLDINIKARTCQVY
jgi:hypothetical protein